LGESGGIKEERELSMEIESSSHLDLEK